jgi:biopolymer transport protein ExbB
MSAAMINMAILLQAAESLQETLTTDSAVLTSAGTDTEMNMLDMAMKGGWIMVVLALLSVVCIYIFFERIYFIKLVNREDPMFMEKIKDFIHEGEIKSALSYCRSMDTPSARMIEKGISRLDRPMNDVQTAIENVGNIEVAKLEKGLQVIATIAGGAPMIGFLGTVTGMVRAFYEMANAGSGNVDITLLSGGIYEAMITTVGGLIVGIVAMFAYNYLVMLVDRVVNKMESRTVAFMDLLNESAKK